MQLKEAFRKLYLASDKEHLLDPFYVYSFLSDYCSSDYQSKKFIKLYYEVSIKVNIFDYLINNEIEVALKLLKSEQKKYDKFFTFSDFKSCVFISLLAYKPDFFDNIKSSPKVAPKPVKKAPKPVKVKPAKPVKVKPQKKKLSMLIRVKKITYKVINSFRHLLRKIRNIYYDSKKISLFAYSKGNTRLKPFDLYSFLGALTELIFLICAIILVAVNMMNSLKILMIVLSFILWFIITILELYKYSYPHTRFIRRGIIINVISLVSFSFFVTLFYSSNYKFLLFIPWVISVLLIYRLIKSTSKFYLETHTIFGGIKYE